MALAAGQWVVESAPDQMTDRPVAQAILRGSGGRLYFRCGGDGPMIAFQPERYLGVGQDGFRGAGDLQLRFDDAPTETEAHWFYRMPLIATTNAEQVSRFADRVARSSRLRVRAIGRASAQDMDFDLTGARDAIADARARCGQTPT